MNISFPWLAWLAGLIGLVTGCVQAGLPSWAMHVQPRHIDAENANEDVTALLTSELQYGRLANDHLSPEQIALVGLRELEGSRLADAGLWLSIASYRYHQQTIEAYERGTAGFDTLPNYVKRAEYQKLVVAEIRSFATLSFYDELRAVAWRRRGQDRKVIALEDQLATLGKTDPIDRESLRDMWAELQPKTPDLKEVSRYPALIEAFRARLRADAANDPEDQVPASYLGITPVASLKKEAVIAAPTHFMPIACLGVAEGFPALRPAMIAALTANRPQTRANAAATLALAPTEETRPILEARLAAEADPQVKLVLAYALAHHGAKEQVTALTTTLQSCGGDACLLPVMLVQWLPNALKVDVDQAPLARIAADAKQRMKARIFAAAALRSVGQQKLLEPASIEALIKAARPGSNDDVRLQEAASEAVAQDRSLSRVAVAARLAGDSPGTAASEDVRYPCALLARLASVSTADDLPLLRKMMRRFGDSEGVEAFYIARGVINIQGADSTATLVNWYSAHKKLQTMIAVNLLSRGDLPGDQLERLIAAGDARTAIVVKALRRDPGLEATLIGRLGSGAIADKFQAAELAGMVGGRPVVPHLHRLIGFHDARYYPLDALVRHSAMTALLRRELARSAPVPPTPAVPPAAKTSP